MWRCIADGWHDGWRMTFNHLGMSNNEYWWHSQTSGAHGWRFLSPCPISRTVIISLIFIHATLASRLLGHRCILYRRVRQCKSHLMWNNGTMVYRLPNFRRTNSSSQSMVTFLASSLKCQPPQLDLKCITHLWGLDHRFLSSLCCGADTKRILPILMISFCISICIPLNTEI